MFNREVRLHDVKIPKGAEAHPRCILCFLYESVYMKNMWKKLPPEHGKVTEIMSPHQHKVLSTLIPHSSAEVMSKAKRHILPTLAFGFVIIFTTSFVQWMDHANHDHHVSHRFPNHMSHEVEEYLASVEAKLE